MTDRVRVCLLSVVAICASRCEKSQVNVLPAAGSASGVAGSPSKPNARFPIRNLIVGACELTHCVLSEHVHWLG